MGQDREDQRLRQEVATPRRPPRAEDDPVFQARRQAADLAAATVRRRSYLLALLWFVGFQFLGTCVAMSGLRATSADLGWALVSLGTFLGNAGSFLGVWYIYVTRSARGDW